MNSILGKARTVFFRDRSAAFILLIFYAVGIAGHIYRPTFPLMVSLTFWVLLIFGLLVFLQIYLRGNRGLLLWALVTYLFTFSMEALGVATGLVFGSYIYGETLGLMLLEVPVVIGFNWMIIVLALSVYVFRRVKNPLAGGLITAAGATLFDWVMEPAAIAMDYWRWAGGEIPLQNYLAWFVIAFICSFAFGAFKLKSSSQLGLYYVGIQLLFFIALRVGGVSL
ncbi:MAG: carotenoid biosynthesis protein [Spirochaetaceae bacterium]